MMMYNQVSVIFIATVGTVLQVSANGAIQAVVFSK